LLGRALVPLLKDACAVTHFDVAASGDGLPFVQGDVRDARAVADACKGVDTIIHAAALHGKAWAAAGDDEGFEVNMIGLKNILEGAARASVKRVAFTSSIWATGHNDPPAPYLPIDEALPRMPVELYGLTKLLGERMCRYAADKYGMSVIVLRPGGIRPAEEYSPLDPRYLFGAVDVRDVARAHVLALGAPDGMRFETFIIAADSPLCGVDPAVYRADPAAALDGCVPGSADALRAAGIDLPVRAEWYSVEKARRMLGYTPEYNWAPSA
jgi:nucleoside-diphosphate-sugar epimerase